MLKRKTILAVTIIFLLLAVGCSVSKEDTKENEPEETQEAETMETKEDDNDLSKEVTLKVWSYSKNENTSYSDASSETVETFVELFDTLFNQKEDTEDIIVMGEECFESVLDGTIKCMGKTIGFLNDGSTIPWKNTRFPTGERFTKSRKSSLLTCLWSRPFWMLPLNSIHSTPKKYGKNGGCYEKDLDDCPVGRCHCILVR